MIVRIFQPAGPDSRVWLWRVENATGKAICESADHFGNPGRALLAFQNFLALLQTGVDVVLED